MKKRIQFLMVILLVITYSCNNDDDAITTADLTLNLSGLDDLGNNFVYEGWIIVNGSPISTGTFSSVTFPQSFTVDIDDLAAASKFVLSIEPTVDPSPDPSATKILAGDFTGNSASVTSNGVVGDFSSSTGTYILATPTDTDMTNEESGVWFLDNSSGSAVAGLNNLPALTGWKYEGWAVMNGMPISTGTFSSGNAADDNAASSPYKGSAGNGPGYPGEDFLQNAPSGLTFPTDLKGTTIVISVEPDPDNSPSPFTFKPLAHMVPTNAANHTAISMGPGPLSFLSGTVTR
ncbi:MAG: hypothetical protein COA67_08520 [Lutibacter sp.]|nr:MAG: hypothetical protein COA67_08520 [Lutibacter sp.]